MASLSPLLLVGLVALILGAILLSIQWIPVSTPQVVKIGVIAPFEGLYRRTGYAVLAEVRRTIEEQQDSLGDNLQVLPVALDDSGDPEQAVRAAQKLLVDPDVQVIIGPFLPHTIAAVANLQPRRPSTQWFPLYETGIEGDESALVSEVAMLGKQQGSERMVIAGLAPRSEKIDDEQWRAQAALPLYLSNEPGDVRGTDLVLWLGDPAGAATYLNQLRLTQPETPFWMGPTGGDPVFAELARSLEHVYWSVKIYAKPPVQGDPSAWQQPSVRKVQQLTQSALNVIRTSHSPLSSLENDDYWMYNFYYFQINEDGSSSPANLSSLRN